MGLTPLLYTERLLLLFVFVLVSSIRAGQGGRFYLIEVVYIVEFVGENVVHLGVLQDVALLIFEPSLPFHHVSQKKLLFLLEVGTRSLRYFEELGTSLSVLI
jgi:hypothetical protein